MKKAENVRGIVMGCLIGVFWGVLSNVPSHFGLEWIPGWTEFFARLIIRAVLFVSLCSLSLLLGRKDRKKRTERSKMDKRILAIAIPISIAALIAMTCWESFSSNQGKVREYLHSPNNKRTAVVVVSEYGSISIYPVYAQYLCKKEYEGAYSNSDFKGCVSISIWTDDEDWTYRWIDEDTLEVVKLSCGEEVKGYVRW